MIFEPISNFNLSIYSKSVTDNLNKNLPIKAPKYKLGPGDLLSIKVFKLPDFSYSTTILADGNINLRRVGLIYISGLTIEQANNKIKEAYKKILKNPIIYLDLISARPIRISVTGEVHRPGLYSIGQNESNQLKNRDGGEGNYVSSKGWPTVVEAIQKAGGVTSQGNLKNIVLIRKDEDSNQVSSYNLNYWQALKTGNIISNPLVFDGDSIRVDKANNLEAAELLIISSSSFSPSSITVNVVGQVVNPGPQKIMSNSPLSKALLSSGGLTRRSKKSKIQLLRLNPNGSVSSKFVNYSPTSELNSEFNPPLRDGDVIIVDRSNWAKTNDSLRSIVEPLSPIVNAFSVYKIIGGD